MSAKNTKLYFVALIPTGKVYERSLELKKEVAERFESRAALRSPPHITLHMPFQYREEKEEKIFSALEAVAKEQSSIPVNHQGFGAFPPRVIYIDVQKTAALEAFRADVVRQLRRSLHLDNADYKDQGFHPHMTIAFRDLKKSRFAEAWDFYRDQEFSAEWSCASVALLKHNGKSWEVWREFGFGGGSEAG